MRIYLDKSETVEDTVVTISCLLLALTSVTLNAFSLKYSYLLIYPAFLLITLVQVILSAGFNNEETYEHQILSYINQIIILLAFYNLRGSVVSLFIFWILQLVFLFLKDEWSIISQYWYIPLYHLSLLYIGIQWNTINFQQVKEETDNMGLYKSILDNHEESTIIVSNNNLQYVNVRFLMKFKMTIIKCVTDRIIN
jgi:hypothetical protein